MYQTDTVIIPITVNLESGAAQMMSLGVMNAPTGLSVMVDPQVDTPGYDAELRLIGDMAEVGNHTIQLRATALTFEKDYYFEVKVIPNLVNPALALVGEYTETGNCSASGAVNNEKVEVSAVSTVFNRINIKGIWKGGTFYTLTANINPDNQTIQIPSQTVNAIQFNGSGSYDGSKIELTYSASGTTVNETCTVTLTK